MDYLTPKQIFHFIVNDFESAWDAIANDPSAKGRGNFMFTMQAMVLLEYGGRLCADDKSSQAIKDWSDSLMMLNPIYFERLPCNSVKIRDFILPYRTSKGDELLWFLWDLIRNGHIHHYHQIIAKLSDGCSFGVCISGADYGLTIERVITKAKESIFHLGFQRDADKSIWLTMSPVLFFLDIKKSIENSGILNRNLGLNWLPRNYKFSSDALHNSFQMGKLNQYL